VKELSSHVLKYIQTYRYFRYHVINVDIGICLLN